MLSSRKIRVHSFLDSGFLADFEVETEANAILYIAVISYSSIDN